MLGTSRMSISSDNGRVAPGRATISAGRADSRSAGRPCEPRTSSGRSGIDLVTVYRTLETLEQCQIVTRIDRLKEGWRYMLRSVEHRHTITCSRCGSSSPLAHCQLASIEQSVERATGFSDIHHSLQFFGICPNCR